MAHSYFLGRRSYSYGVDASERVHWNGCVAEECDWDTDERSDHDGMPVQSTGFCTKTTASFGDLHSYSSEILQEMVGGLYYLGCEKIWKRGCNPNQEWEEHRDNPPVPVCVYDGLTEGNLIDVLCECGCSSHFICVCKCVQADGTYNC